ncbi:adhesion G-protein coupled receptor F1-like isoform X2 [Hemitrygon akajei]|uniref:adhesion G-protein coupled receptor F1-like isoform X1 n=1 Tax=Hemitrygon akajei TaxID=2704970 RepID=UPI003BF98602
MMLHIIFAFWLLLPFSDSMAEANQCSSAQPSMDQFNSFFQLFDGHQFQVNVIRNSKRSYHSNMNFEKVHFDLVTEYMKRLIFPLNVSISGRDAYLIILNISTKIECKYIGNGSKCFFWNETIQEYNTSDLPECSKSSKCNCSYSMINGVGFCRQNATNLLNSVAAHGMFKLPVNESHHDDLQNKSSNAYKKLENTYSNKLARSFSILNGFQCVKITNISNQSTIVEFQLNINGELKSERFLSQSKDAISLINEDAINTLKLSITGLLKMEVTPAVVHYNKKFTVNCIIRDLAEESKWFIKAPKDKKNAPISKRLYQFQKNVEQSTSRFEVHATSIWEGSYTCILTFENGSITHEASSNVKVHLLPEEIVVKPLNYTVLQERVPKESIKFQCCIKNDNESYVVSVKQDGDTDAKVYNQTETLDGNKCWRFEVNSTENNTVYKCTFQNDANQSKDAKFSIYVLKQNAKTCSEEMKSEYHWDRTKPNSYMEANASCPANTSGKILRFCKENGDWDQVFENCTSKYLLNLLYMATEIREGRGNVTEVLTEVLTDLKNGIKDLKSSRFANPDSRVSVSILDTLSEVLKREDVRVSNQSFIDLIAISNSILLQKTGSNDTDLNSNTLLMSIETFAAALQPDADVNSTMNQITISTEQFNTTSKDYHFQMISNSSTSINLTGWTPQDNVTFQVLSVLYEDLDEILIPEEQEAEQSKEQVKAQTNILTITMNVVQNRSLLKIPNITITFPPKNAQADLNTAKCVFWKQQSWSNEGCESKRIGDKIRCTCNHLTSFAVLMATKERDIPFLEELTYIGLSISILSLLIWISIEKIMWQTITKTTIAYSRHITQFNTAIALLFAQISFVFGAIELVKKDKSLCITATIFTHYFFLSMFFWTLNQSLTLLHQIIFVFHHIRRVPFLSFCFILGYGCPLVIVISAASIFLKKNNYKLKNNCWLALTPSFSFIIPVGCIVSINMIILTVVILKLLRPKISEGLMEQDKKTIKKIIKAVLILTPSFGLTWIIGFALDEESHDILHYIFVLLNTLQGFFMLVTAGFTEAKMRETFFKNFRSMVSRSTSEVVTTKQSFQSSTK